jgi:anti-sigma factor RsiW
MSLDENKARNMTGRPVCSEDHDIQSNDALAWLAMQYVLGELPEIELSAFEERLASDFAACEAVADSTRLMLTLQSAVTEAATVALPEIENRSGRSAKTTPRGSWLALAGATAAAAVLLAAMSLGPNRPRQDQLARADRSASELVSLWRSSSATAEADTDELEVEVAESNHDVAVPNWLFAAVSLEQSKADGDSTEEWQEN